MRPLSHRQSPHLHVTPTGGICGALGLVGVEDSARGRSPALDFIPSPNGDDDANDAIHQCNIATPCFPLGVTAYFEVNK